MGFKYYKFRELAEAEFHLNGGIFGGDPKKLYKVAVGDTLTFTQPAGSTVTFAAGATPGVLSFKELKQQVEAVVTGLLVLMVGDRTVFVESSPSNGVIVTGGTARTALGLDDSATITGRIYTYPPGNGAPVLPHWVAGYFADGHHTVVVKE